MSNFQRENDAAKSLFRRLESAAEIERHRAECQWDMIPALIDQLLTARIHEDDDYGILLLAEALLEECLQENMDLLRSSTPLVDKNQVKLCRARGHLNTILSRGRLSPRYLNEALLLMAKVHYVHGRYRDAQGMCARVSIEELTQDEQPIYHLRLLAEAFVIKGLSLDQQTLSSVSRVRLSEREEESLTCYLRACDTAVVTTHSKTAKGALPCHGPVDVELGFFLQAALQSAYLCLLQRGHLAQGTHQLRRVLRVVETRSSQHFRKSAARKLAEVLLSSVSEDGYWAPLGAPPTSWLLREGTATSKDAMYPRVRPPQRYPIEGSFCPQDVVEEAVLLLLVTESMAGAEAVISRSSRQAEVRKASLRDATSVYDLLSIGMARRGQYAMLSKCLERAMKFSFNEFHLWHQLGLSLMAAGKLEEAKTLSQSVVCMGEEAREFLPRAHLALGLCSSLQASHATLKADRDTFNMKALEALKKAHSLDPQDALIAMYLALQLALVRQVSSAMEPLQVALSLRGDDLHSLHLLVLLLSAQKHHRHALDTLKLALSQHPHNFNEGDDSSSVPAAERPEVHPGLRKISITLTLPDFQDVSTGSLSAPSVVASRLDAAFSEMSNISSAHRQGPSYVWATLERIWLHAGELFIADGRLKEAQFCVAEAGSLSPNSHGVLLQRGRLAELRGRPDEAKGLYDEALAIHPTGQRVLIHMLLVRMGRVHLGEKVLRDAVQAHSTSHEAWSGLGDALQSRGSSQAPDCFLTALELEATSPIRPFTVIPREL
ncbi:hypothetical protein NHX12_022403 [Muraenolepis orangiensis]|uniref:Tetratricopeptide repeat protein 7 N-terminal domain-containing protein n=1 Tax=Muraenolepis orangiensis TaxID=630683 RepID=A0A9Q0ERH9_9TELE|nr:hypothetical protein NHX12_022403 [Muraenolepis orangiensis]